MYPLGLGLCQQPSEAMIRCSPTNSFPATSTPRISRPTAALHHQRLALGCGHRVPIRPPAVAATGNGCAGFGRRHQAARSARHASGRRATPVRGGGAHRVRYSNLAHFDILIWPTLDSPGMATFRDGQEAQSGNIRRDPARLCGRRDGPRTGQEAWRARHQQPDSRCAIATDVSLGGI